MAKGDMNVKVGVDTQPLEQGLTKSKALLIGFAGGIGALVGNIIGGVIRNVGSFITESVKAANEQLQAENQLLVALKGRADAQQNLIAQAKELQKTTIFGDDETVKAQARLAIYVKEEEQLRRLTPLVQDLATAKGMDLAVASEMVGRAIASEGKTIRGLGITLEGAAGSAEKAESAINELTIAVGGQAAAAAKAGTGPITQMKNLWSDLKEEIGIQLIPVLNSLAKWFSDKLPKITEWIGSAFGSWYKNFAYLKYVIQSVVNSFQYWVDLVSRGRIFAETMYAASDAVNVRTYEEAKKNADKIAAESKKISAGIIDISNAEEENKKKTDALQTAYEKLNSELGRLNKLLDDQLLKESPRAFATAERIRRLQEEIDLVKRLKDALTQPVTTPPTKPADAKAAVESLLPRINVPETLDPRPVELMNGALEAQSEIIQKLTLAWRGFESAISSAELAKEAFSAAYQQATQQDIKNVEDFGRVVYNVIREIIVAEAAKAISGAVANALSSVPPPLNLIAAAAAGATTAAAFAALVPKLASGGLAYSPTLAMVGDNPNAGSDPEVIAPLSKLAGILGKNRGDVNVRGRLVGEDIYLTNQRAWQRVNRANGY